MERPQDQTKARAEDDAFKSGMAPFVRVDGILARGLYWLFAVLAVLSALAAALDVYRQSTGAGPTIGILPPAGMFAAAIALYVAGWVLRWLFTGRVDHWFGSNRHYNGRFENARKQLAAMVSFIT